jgi:ornithine carbamoyltransferase
MDTIQIKAFSQSAKGEVRVSNRLDSELVGADVIYTDCWPHSLPEEDAARIRHDFASYQVTSEKLRLAKPGCFFLPCPPVTRGEEVSEEVMQTYGATVYEAKEYLLHAQNAILSHVL